MKEIARGLLKVQSFGGGVCGNQYPDGVGRVVECLLDQVAIGFIHTVLAAAAE